jgi:hypothetical protein
MNPAAEGDGESTTPWRAMAVVEGGTRKQQEDGQQQQEEEKEELEEEELDNTILQVTLHPSSFVRIHKMSFPELCKSFRFLFSFLGKWGFGVLSSSLLFCFCLSRLNFVPCWKGTSVSFFYCYSLLSCHH